MNNHAEESFTSQQAVVRFWQRGYGDSLGFIDGLKEILARPERVRQVR